MNKGRQMKTKMTRNNPHNQAAIIVLVRASWLLSDQDNDSLQETLCFFKLTQDGSIQNTAKGRNKRDLTLKRQNKTKFYILDP